MGDRSTRPLRCLAIALWLASTVGAEEASAQNLYLEGHFGGSEAKIETGPGITDPRFTIDADEDDHDRSIVGGAAMGFRFPLEWALDAELPRYMPEIGFRLEEEASLGRDYDAFTRNEFGQGDSQFVTSVDAWTMMTNLWVEVPVYRAWSWTAGAGIGPVFLEGKVRQSYLGIQGKDQDVRFGWQVGTGIEYSFDETVTMGFGYRYFVTEEFKVNVDERRTDEPVGESSINLSAHEFLVRLRVNFYTFR